MDQTRRGFLRYMVFAVNAATGILLAVPGLGYVLGPLFGHRRSQWVEAGPLESFQGKEPKLARLKYISSAGYRESPKTQNVWILADESRIAAYSTECPHLGCNVTWKGNEDWKGAKGIFACPCHGGKFDRAGNVLAGPPPTPLKQLPAKTQEGKIYVQV